MRWPTHSQYNITTYMLSNALSKKKNEDGMPKERVMGIKWSGGRAFLINSGFKLTLQVIVVAYFVV